MGRLADTLKRAADARAGLETAVERDVTKYVERVDQIHKRREDVFMKQHRALDADVSDLAEMEKDLEDFGKNDQSRNGETSKDKDGNAYIGTSPPKL